MCPLAKIATAGQVTAFAVLLVFTPCCLAADDLEAGRLVRPFELSLPTAFGYYIVYPERRADRPKIAVFRDWLLEEAAAGERSGQTV